MVSLNQDFVAYQELKALLDRLLELYPRYRLLAKRYHDMRERGLPFRSTSFRI